MTMELHLNDILELKKDHPCGSRRWKTEDRKSVV